MDKIMELIQQGLEMNRRLNKQVVTINIHYYPESSEHLAGIIIGDDYIVISMDKSDEYKIKELKDALEALDDNT